MPEAIPDFFIKFLTKPGDIVLDPFAGSNVTGMVAERLGRKWISIEVNPKYAESSFSRFRLEDIIWSTQVKHEMEGINQYGRI